MSPDLTKQFQTMIVLWLALLTSVGVYFPISLIVPTKVSTNDSPSTLPVLALVLLGAFLVVVSFVVKKKLLESSIERQDVGLVQKAMVIACALCEACGMLGLLEHFIVGTRASYLLFALAAGGIALHCPRQSQLEAASYKSRSTLS